MLEGDTRRKCWRGGGTMAFEVNISELLMCEETGQAIL